MELLTQDLPSVAPAEHEFKLQHPAIQPQQRSTLLPPHGSLKSWYDFESAKLSDDVATKGSTFDMPYPNRDMRMYGTGKEGKFLAQPREAPRGFHEVSDFKSVEDVKKCVGVNVNLSKKSAKSIDKQLRVGLSASSYAGHFVDGIQHAFGELKKLIEAVQVPPESSDFSRLAINAHKEKIAPVLDRLDSHIEGARTSTCDVVGSLTAMDVNFNLVSRDRLLSHLDSYLDEKVEGLRNATCMSENIFPTFAKVKAEAPELAQTDSSRKIAKATKNLLEKATQSQKGESKSQKRKASGKTNHSEPFPDGQPSKKKKKRSRRGKGGKDSKGPNQKSRGGQGGNQGRGSQGKNR